MEVLTSRVLLRPRDAELSRRFYGETLGLAVYREFGPPDNPGVVFFIGTGLLEISPAAGRPSGAHSTALWLQVRDIDAERDRLVAAGVSIAREPREEPWGLVEMWLNDPDGVPIMLVQVPEDHPLRRDRR